jgi:hypothetical protein
MISALVAAGIAGGYLASPRLKEVHWQAGDRPLPAPQVSVGGESPLFVVEGWEADITASSPQSLWTALPVVTAPRVGAAERVGGFLVRLGPAQNGGKACHGDLLRASCWPRTSKCLISSRTLQPNQCAMADWRGQATGPPPGPQIRARFW